jgi:hypothetical protein
MFTYSGVQHILWCVFPLFVFCQVLSENTKKVELHNIDYGFMNIKNNKTSIKDKPEFRCFNKR